MNHVTTQLQAYYDGELNRRATAAVEAHLAECETCRAELESWGSLSALLQEAPAAHPRISEDRFVAQVTLRLPRTPMASLPERTIKRGWSLAPVVLVATWAFLQATAILTAGMIALIQLGVGGPALASLLPQLTAGGAYGMGLPGGVLDALGSGQATEIVGWLSRIELGAIVPVIFTALTALAICSWVAMWWAVQHPSSDASKTE